MDHKIVPSHSCLRCGYVSDHVSIAYEDDTPMPQAGDYTMCLCCGLMMVFNKDLSVRLPNSREEDELLNNAQITQMQIARASIVGDKIKEKRKRKSESESGSGTPQ